MGEMLENMGVQVLYTRTTDVYQSPNEKAAMGNRSDADFFISLHRNANAGAGKRVQELLPWCMKMGRSWSSG